MTDRPVMELGENTMPKPKALGMPVPRAQLVENVFLSIVWVLLHAGLASQALRKLFAGRTAWPAFRAKHETTIF